MLRALLVVFLCAASVTAVSAQTSARLLIGVSGYTLSGEPELDVTPVFRLAGGGGISHQLSSALSLRTEILYTIQGGEMSGTVTGVLNGAPAEIPVDALFDLTYLEIPVLAVFGAEFRRGSRVELGLGPGFGFRLDSHSTFSTETGAGFSQRADGPKRIVGLVFSADYIIPLGSEQVLFGIRGWLSSTKAGLEETVPGADNLRSRGLTFVSGLVF
ncbi:MAG: hypothetical protein ACI80V_002331 [Rhodothermales bacterium]|jgi:hypothetical protein